jgi:sugar lactone lactonase YvrE
VLGDGRGRLGEGPVWDGEADRLLRVDIAAGELLTSRAPHDQPTTVQVGGEPSAVVPRSPGGVLVAIGHELVAFDPRWERRTLATVEVDQPDNRFNDCRCDPQGRLWAGTMNKRGAPGTAALYRLEAGRPIERVVSNTTLSNGIGWSPAGDRMYFVDSTAQRIDAFDFDGSTGTIGNRRPFATVDPSDGLPDGLAVDAEGGLWLCLFGGAALRRYGEAGTLDEVIELPVTRPTCPAFGGPGRRTLFVTSARRGLSPGQLAREPFAGGLLTLEPGVAGLPAHRFAG